MQLIIPGGKGVEIFKYKKQLKFWPFSTSAGFLAAALWIRWNFSLRTLFIVTTIVAAVMGLIVYAMQ